jgi:hypothetical protein
MMSAMLRRHYPWGPLPPEMIRHRVSEEPGLSSFTTFDPGRSGRPTDRPTRQAGA